MEIYVAISDFTPPIVDGSQNILEFKKGDSFEIFDSSKTEADWWGARALKTDLIGYVPSRYMQYEEKRIGKLLPEDYKDQKETSLKRLSDIQSSPNYKAPDQVIPETPVPDYEDIASPENQSIFNFAEKFKTVLSSINKIESKQEVTEWLNDYLDLHTPSEPSTHKSKTLTDRRPVAHKSTIDKTPNVLSKVRETQRSVTLPVSENDDTSAVTVSRPADTATSKEVRETQRSVTLPVSENDDTSAVTVSKPADTATSKEGSSEQATQQATRRSLTFTENDDTSVSSPADYFHRPASKEAGLCKEGSSEKYVTMTQLEGILDGYVRKSEFRRLKRKLEEAPAVAENDDCELEQVISSQKGPFEAVEAALLKLFTIEEIKSHSATGKKANSVTPAKPRFEAAKFNLMAKLVEKHFKIGHKDIVLKTQAVKRKFAKQ